MNHTWLSIATCLIQKDGSLAKSFAITNQEEWSPAWVLARISLNCISSCVLDLHLSCANFPPNQDQKITSHKHDISAPLIQFRAPTKVAHDNVTKKIEQCKNLYSFNRICIRWMETLINTWTKRAFRFEVDHYCSTWRENLGDRKSSEL